MTWKETKYMATFIHSIELMNKAAQVCYMDLSIYMIRFFMKIYSFYFLFVLLHNKSKKFKEVRYFENLIIQKSIENIFISNILPLPFKDSQGHFSLLGQPHSARTDA